MLQDTTNTAVSAALRKTPRAEGIEAADPEAKVARAETAALAAGDFASDAAPMEHLPPPATAAGEGQCAAEAESCAPPCAMEGAHGAAGHDAPEAGAGFREAGALKQHVTGSFHARTLARGGLFGNRVDGCVDCARTVLLLT